MTSQCARFHKFLTSRLITSVKEETMMKIYIAKQTSFASIIDNIRYSRGNSVNYVRQKVGSKPIRGYMK